MKKPQIRRIVPHIVQPEHAIPLSNRVADLHAQIISNRLSKLELTAAQKTTVIDQILVNMKSAEVHSATR